MDSSSSSSSSSPSSVEYSSRSDIRRAIHSIIRQLLLQRLAQQREQQPHALNINDRSLPLRLTKAQHRRALRQSHLLEDILYRRASSLAEYQDLSTLEERVFKAGRAVYINAQRRELERESYRRVRMNGGDDTAAGGQESRRCRSSCCRRGSA